MLVQAAACSLTQTSAYYCGLGSILACIFSNETILVLIIC